MTSLRTNGKATPYLPIIDLLKAYFQIEDHDDGRRMHEKLTGRLLTLAPALGPTLPAFLALLEVPVEDAYWQALEPAQRHPPALAGQLSPRVSARLEHQDLPHLAPARPTTARER
jgi:hypothetical protein